jgi:hypothetical protein
MGERWLIVCTGGKTARTDNKNSHVRIIVTLIAHPPDDNLDGILDRPVGNQNQVPTAACQHRSVASASALAPSIVMVVFLSTLKSECKGLKKIVS